MFHRGNPLLLFIVMGAFTLTLAAVNLKKILQEGNNQLSGKMLSNVVDLQPNKSIVISGFSLLTPLSLLELASSGSTSKELLNAIGLLNNDFIFQIFSQIVQNLKETKGIHLTMINKVLVNMNYQLNDLFEMISRLIFDTKILNIDFSDAEQAAKTINHWIYRKTNHQIKKTIDPSFIDEETKAVLVNVLCFKGKWKYPFSRQMTRKEIYYRNNQTLVKVLMMNNTARYKYAESRKLDAKILEMPYAGDEASMVLVLPNQIEGIKKTLRQLQNLSILDEEMKYMNLADVDVTIPKFRIETTIDVKDVLKRMNVTIMFTNEAEINKLIKSRESLYISKAIQKVFVEVEETDTKAGAANDNNGEEYKKIILNTRQQDEEKTDKKIFVANHPFAVYVKIKGITLFSLFHDDMSI